MSNDLLKHKTKDNKVRITVDAKIEEFDNPTTVIKSFHYPLLVEQRWDNIDSNNNEDLFRGLLVDYTSDYSDKIGQALMLGVRGSDENDVITTASYRGVYRTNHDHEAHICVGTDPKNERRVESIVVASNKKVEVRRPLTLPIVWDLDDVKDPEVGTIVFFVNDEYGCIAIYNNAGWYELAIGQKLKGKR